MAWDDIAQWQPQDLLASLRMGDGVQPVDCRELTWREAGTTVRNAMRIDPMAFMSEIDSLPRDKEIVFYCDRPGEATSMKIALTAFDRGYARVGVLVGGFDAWQAAGYPVDPKP